MNIDRSVLFVAEFNDAYHAHFAQRRRALERLGATVTVFDLKARPSLLARFRAGDLGRRLEHSIDEAQPDLVIVNGNPELDEEMVERLRGRVRARWINWLPHDLRQISEAIVLARPFDHIYTIGTDIAAEMADRLGRTVDVLAFAADPSVYRPIKTRDQYRANVVFAGSATPRRERLLAELVEFGLAVWGPGWRKTTLRDYCRGEVRAPTSISRRMLVLRSQSTFTTRWSKTTRVKRRATSACSNWPRSVRRRWSMTAATCPAASSQAAR